MLLRARPTLGAYSGCGYRHHDEGTGAPLFSLTRLVAPAFRWRAQHYGLTAEANKKLYGRSLNAKEIVRERARWLTRLRAAN